MKKFTKFLLGAAVLLQPFFATQAKAEDAFSFNMKEWINTGQAMYLPVSVVEDAGWFYSGPITSSSGKQCVAGSSFAIYMYKPEKKAYMLNLGTLNNKTSYEDAGTSRQFLIHSVSPGTLTYNILVISDDYTSNGQYSEYAWTGLVQMTPSDADPTTSSTWTPGNPLQADGQDGAAIYKSTTLNIEKKSDFSAGTITAWYEYSVTYQIPKGVDYVGITADNIFIVSAEFTPAAASTYEITGTVTEAGSTEAVEGATVTLGDVTATTSATGEFTLSDVPEGAATLTVTADGYVTYSQADFDPSTQTGALAIQLTPQSSTLELTFVDSSEGMGSNVNVTQSDGTVSLYAGETAILTNVAATDGVYTLTVKGALNADGYTLKASFPYYNEISYTINSTSDIKFTLGDTEEANFSLNAYGQTLTLTVNVQDAAQEAIENATVTSTYKDAADAALTFTYNSDSKAYVATGIYAPYAKDTEYAVTATVAGYKSATEDVAFDGENQTVILVLALDATTVTGTVIDSASEPVAGATVTLLNGSSEIVSGTTASDGSYTLTINGAVPETVTIQVTANGYDNYTATLDTIEQGGTLTQNVTLTADLSALKSLLESGKAGKIYNLNGVEVGNGKALIPGIYIVDGKKVVVK
ncbi:MAG: carboxypeptidase regulatory-like domain-containing protein [Muribaculaceae bacterium]|nr:carboxypeptidase regulatory-like domain-containing protein [Muribaculaceae bacterium]